MCPIEAILSAVATVGVGWLVCAPGLEHRKNINETDK